MMVNLFVIFQWQAWKPWLQFAEEACASWWINPACQTPRETNQRLPVLWSCQGRQKVSSSLLANFFILHDVSSAVLKPSYEHSGVIGAFNFQGAGWCRVGKKNLVHDEQPRFPERSSVCHPGTGCGLTCKGCWSKLERRRDNVFARRRYIIIFAESFILYINFQSSDKQSAAHFLGEVVYLRAEERLLACDTEITWVLGVLLRLRRCGLVTFE